MKILKRLLMIVGLITVIGAIIVFVFMNTATNSDKKKLMEDIGIENSGIARDLASEVFVDCEIITARKNILGTKWVIDGKMFTTNQTMAFSKEKIKFIFSDGDEIYSFNSKLNANQVFARPFQVRIAGHLNASFLRAEVIEAK